MSPQMRDRLFYVEGSARVKRWHTEPVLHQQTVGEHTYGVVYLTLFLTDWQASRNLLIAALMHDTAERKFGDVPSPTKKLAGIKQAMDALEDEHMERLGLTIPELSPEEAQVLKLADNLEGGMFCAFEVRRGNRDIQTGFNNYIRYIEQMNPTGLALDILNDLKKEYNSVFTS